MKDALNKKLLEYVEKTDVFLSDQVPDYINQLLKYNLFETTVWLSANILVLLLCIGGVKYGYDLPREGYSQTLSMVSVLSYIAGGSGIFISFCGMTGHLLKLIKIKITPKVFIVEKLKR